jgi:hypothetical protein
VGGNLQAEREAGSFMVAAAASIQLLGASHALIISYQIAAEHIHAMKASACVSSISFNGSKT